MENFIPEKINFSSRSPLRYPGGKTRAIHFITQFFPPDANELLSPFFGGGSIELFVAAKGTKVYGYDIFFPLAEFWDCLLKNANELANAVQQHFPLQKDEFYLLQKKQTEFKTKLERAAVYYVLNRSSFSGATLSGGMSPNHPRFTETSIERLKNYYNPNVKVAVADYKTALQKHPDMFAYLDPPYMIKSSLYGTKGNAHKNFDHAGLANILKQRKRWILSYNDCAEIREVYKDFSTLSPTWKYGMPADKLSKEVLIFSKDLK